VGLRSKGGSGKTRSDVLGDPEKARLASYQHRGRFRSDLLVEFDSRDGVNKGDQFKYALNNDGAFSKVGNEVLAEHEFLALVDQVEEFLRRYGQEIYEGNVSVEPYRHQQKTACDYCDYRSICRFDPWVEPYRVLRPEPKAE
jgi:ATP-dependent helicase/nuclease subunit B